MLLDANVLVDYLAVDLEVLALVHAHVGPVHIVSTVLVEVGGLETDECERLGFRIVEPSLDQVLSADSGGGPLAFVAEQPKARCHQPTLNRCAVFSLCVRAASSSA